MSENLHIKIRSIVGSFLCYGLLVFLYCIKTIYYYWDNYVLWWLYLLALTLLYLLNLFYLYRNRPYRRYVLLTFAMLIALLPFETEVPRLVGVVTDSREFLSPLAQKLPNVIVSIAFDVLFYPVTTLILLHCSVLSFNKN